MKSWFFLVGVFGVVHAECSYRPLPSGKLIVGYAPSCSDEDGSSGNVVKAVEDGVNVVIWSFVSLSNVSNSPSITGGPNISCVKSVIANLDSLGFSSVVHMISIGGWDAPHPSPIVSGSAWYQIFKTWNEVYDGVDWDLEGNDNIDSSYNILSNTTLRLMHDFSAAAKADSAIVSIVPPQSYLDTTESRYDESLTHAYLDWYSNFTYRGRNAYAPLLLQNASLYDFVSLQLYESWSRASQAIEQLHETPASYLIKLVHRLHLGWLINYQGKLSRLRIDSAQKLVLGFSAGSADSPPQKSIYISPEDVALAYAQLLPDLQFRGAMFWNINIDTCYLTNGTQVNCDFAAGFNSFLRTLPSASSRFSEQL